MLLESLRVIGVCSGQWKTQACHCDLEITFCLCWEQAQRCLSYIPLVSESVASPMVMTSSLKKSGNPGKGELPHLDFISPLLCKLSLTVKL